MYTHADAMYTQHQELAGVGQLCNFVSMWVSKLGGSLRPDSRLGRYSVKEKRLVGRYLRNEPQGSPPPHSQMHTHPEEKASQNTGGLSCLAVDFTN